MSASGTSRWTEDLRRQGRVVLTTDRASMLRGLVLLVVLTAGSAFVIGMGSIYTIAGYVGIVFFGVLGIPVIAWKAITARPVTRIDARGVAIDGALVEWAAIDRITTFSVAGADMVVLVLTERAARERAGDEALSRRMVAEANARLMGGPVVALPSHQGVDVAELAAWLTGLRAQHR